MKWVMMGYNKSLYCFSDKMHSVKKKVFYQIKCHFYMSDPPSNWDDFSIYSKSWVLFSQNLLRAMHAMQLVSFQSSLQYL